MRWWIIAAALLAAIVAFTAPRDVEAQDAGGESDCMVDPLGPVSEYDVVTLGDVNWTTGETEGRMVVGRDATFDQLRRGHTHAA